MTDHGFAHHRAHSPTTIPLFKLWIEQGITYEDLSEAIQIANDTNGGQPGSPVYYRNFISQLKANQKRTADDWQQAQQPTHTPRTGGRPNAKITTPEERRRIFESGYHPDQNRKLTPGERSRVAYGTDPTTLRKFDEQQHEHIDRDDAIDSIAWLAE